MEQMTMFDVDIQYPQTYADIEELYNKYIYEGEKDSDAFEHEGPKDGTGGLRNMVHRNYGQHLFRPPWE